MMLFLQVYSFGGVARWEGSRWVYSFGTATDSRCDAVFGSECSSWLSLKFEINNAALSWVSKLCRELVGPVLVCGDFNSPLQRWPTVRRLLENGWVIGLLPQNEATGEEPQSTCLGTVRHSLHIAKL